MSHPVPVAGLVGEEELSCQLHGLTAGKDYRIRSTDTWLIARTADTAEHGWKLHISTRAATLGELADLLLPLLVDEGCSFKLAKSGAVLARLNDGITAPAAVGKAFTVYPEPDRVHALGQRLAGLLDGHVGPRILSDRRVSATAPVYYRYGPFMSRWRSDSAGRLLSTLTGPSGERFDAPATLNYRRPEWALDPFAGDAEELPAGHVIGGRYEITAGVLEAARGNVYRAQAAGDARPLIVKQARAFVAEDGRGLDARSRLRNERRVLAALAGLADVPSFVDHFRHGADEYLVITDQGRQNLTEDVNRSGRYTADPARSLPQLGRRLAGILCAVHQRGVVSRDVAPKNVIVDGDRVSLIDFGISALDGYELPGSTPGYAAPSQIRGEPGRASDDAYALGMTLLFAATGAHPVTSSDGELSRVRALQALAFAPSRFAGVAGTIAALIGADEAMAVRALSRLAQGILEPERTHAAAAELPVLTPQMLDAIIDGLRERLLVQTRALIADPSGRAAGNDASCYNGASGIGLELLHHLDRPGVAELLVELGQFAHAAALRTDLPPGLYLGTTGVQIFLQQLVNHGIDVPLLAERQLAPGGSWQPEGDDLFVGRAGLGLGHLMLAFCGAVEPAVHRQLGTRYLSEMMAAESLHSPYDAAGQDIDPADGRAHGLAGEVEPALRLAMLEPAARPDARRLTDRLAATARALIRRAAEPDALPLAVSWCRGLAGIGHTLLTAAALFDDRELLALAEMAGHRCRDWIPQLSAPGQCCGLAGVGSYLLRLGQVSRDPAAFLGGARQAGVQLLLRSVGTGLIPEFDERDVRFNPVSWSAGDAGILAFFRCLRAERFEELLPLAPAWAA